MTTVLCHELGIYMIYQSDERSCFDLGQMVCTVILPNVSIDLNCFVRREEGPILFGTLDGIFLGTTM